MDLHRMPRPRHLLPSTHAVPLRHRRIPSVDRRHLALALHRRLGTVDHRVHHRRLLQLRHHRCHPGRHHLPLGLEQRRHPGAGRLIHERPLRRRHALPRRRHRTAQGRQTILPPRRSRRTQGRRPRLLHQRSLTLPLSRSPRRGTTLQQANARLDGVGRSHPPRRHTRHGSPLPHLPKTTPHRRRRKGRLHDQRCRTRRPRPRPRYRTPPPHPGGPLQPMNRGPQRPPIERPSKAPL